MIRSCVVSQIIEQNLGKFAGKKNEIGMDDFSKKETHNSIWTHMFFEEKNKISGNIDPKAWQLISNEDYFPIL